MFDTVTAASPWEIPTARRTRLLGGALVVHTALFAIYLIATLWTIAPVAPPELPAIFVPEPPIPIVTFVPIPPPPREASRSRDSGPSAPPAESAAPAIAQPRDVAELGEAPPASDLDPTASSRSGAGESTLPLPSGIGGAASEEGPRIWNPSMTPPRILHRVEPRYPEMARRAKRQGTVILEAEIGKDGRLRSARAVNTPLGFGLEEAALAALAQWRFEPAESAGEPLAVYYRLSVNFRLN